MGLLSLGTETNGGNWRCGASSVPMCSAPRLSRPGLFDSCVFSFLSFFVLLKIFCHTCSLSNQIALALTPSSVVSNHPVLIAFLSKTNISLEQLRTPIFKVSDDPVLKNFSALGRRCNSACTDLLIFHPVADASFHAVTCSIHLSCQSIG